jgi:hypothetical protein
MPETSGRGAELLALSGYNGRAVQTKKERSLTWGNGSAGKTRIYFRPFEGGVALLGAAAFAAVGPWRGAFAGLPWVTVASTFVLFLAQGALLVRWSLREYLSGAALPPAAFVISTSDFALLGVPMLVLQSCSSSRSRSRPCAGRYRARQSPRRGRQVSGPLPCRPHLPVVG